MESRRWSSRKSPFRPVPLSFSSEAKRRPRTRAEKASSTGGRAHPSADFCATSTESARVTGCPERRLCSASRGPFGRGKGQRQRLDERQVPAQPCPNQVGLERP